MRRYSERIYMMITIVIVLFLIAGILIYGFVKLKGDCSEESVINPVLYQEKSVPIQPSDAIPDTDSNDEGMQD